MDDDATLGWAELAVSVTCEAGWVFFESGCTTMLGQADLGSSVQLAGMHS